MTRTRIKNSLCIGWKGLFLISSSWNNALLKIRSSQRSMDREALVDAYECTDQEKVWQRKGESTILWRLYELWVRKIPRVPAWLSPNLLLRYSWGSGRGCRRSFPCDKQDFLPQDTCFRITRNTSSTVRMCCLHPYCRSTCWWFHLTCDCEMKQSVRSMDSLCAGNDSSVSVRNKVSRIAPQDHALQ